jgi:ribosome-binding protein aMBF1 (putative translation factor)
MTYAEQMTASYFETYAKKCPRKWPVTNDMVSKRKEQADKVKEAERTRAKAQALAREHEKEMAKKEGRKARRNVLTKPISTDLIGGRIREARMKMGMTMREFADTQGFHLSDMSGWERGIRPPKAEKLEKLAKALGVTETWLREGK